MQILEENKYDIEISIKSLKEEIKLNFTLSMPLLKIKRALEYKSTILNPEEICKIKNK